MKQAACQGGGGWLLWRGGCPILHSAYSAFGGGSAGPALRACRVQCSIKRAELLSVAEQQPALVQALGSGQAAHAKPARAQVARW